MTSSSVFLNLFDSLEQESIRTVGLQSQLRGIILKTGIKLLDFLHILRHGERVCAGLRGMEHNDIAMAADNMAHRADRSHFEIAEKLTPCIYALRQSRSIINLS